MVGVSDFGVAVAMVHLARGAEPAILCAKSNARGLYVGVDTYLSAGAQFDWWCSECLVALDGFLEKA